MYKLAAYKGEKYKIRSFDKNISYEVKSYRECLTGDQGKG